MSMELMPGFAVDSRKVAMVLRGSEVNRFNQWKMNSRARNVLEDAETRKRYIRLAGKRPVRCLIQLDASCEFMTFGSPMSYDWVKREKDREDDRANGASIPRARARARKVEA